MHLSFQGQMRTNGSQPGWDTSQESPPTYHRLKQSSVPSVVVHAWNPSTWERYREKSLQYKTIRSYIASSRSA